MSIYAFTINLSVLEMITTIEEGGSASVVIELAFVLLFFSVKETSVNLGNLLLWDICMHLLWWVL